MRQRVTCCSVLGRAPGKGRMFTAPTIVGWHPVRRWHGSDRWWWNRCWSLV